MKRSLILPESLQELIRHLPPHLKRRIRSALEEILVQQEIGKELTQELQGFRSHKLGQIRMIYRLPTNSTLEIVAIGPRKSIYEKIALEIKRKHAENP